MSGPMDPERLAELRENVAEAADFCASIGLDAGCSRLSLTGQLLNAHDHYRSRCPVTAEDVEAAGVTREHAEQWLHRLGFHPYECMAHSTLWRDIETEQHACTTSRRPGDLAAAIGILANASAEQCAFDILDEMAAMDTGAEVGQ